jgi:DNA-binding transcriptional LysR family regulator
MVDLRHLRYFIAVAEAEHVGNAAQRLHISQSPLSRQIRQLEEDLGLTLFERSRKRLRLTQAGQSFLKDARMLIAEAERVVERARSAARGDSGTLTLGYVTGVLHSGFLPAVLRRFRRPHSEVQVELRMLRSSAQLEALRRRQLDAGFVYTPPEDDDPELTTFPVVNEPLMLALPEEHPLANKAAIVPQDLDGMPWIALPRAINPAARERFLTACSESGFAPDLRFEADEPLTALSLVSAGLGATLVQASLGNAGQNGIKLCRLPWFPLKVEAFAVFRQEERSPLIDALLVKLKAVSKPNPTEDRS